ncbi:MAG: LLM class F420-dependent oxidoreductase [Candidatus Tectimicrobiota bacterium]
MRTQLGAFFPTRDIPADRLAIRDWAQAAEAIGFDFIEVSDHVLGADRAALPNFEGPYDVDDSFHETFVTLAYIAAVTERIGLASGVLILPQRQTALVAKQAAQLDVLCGGRLRLGVGVGWNPVEYEALGQQWQVRGKRQAEQIVLMQQLWTQRTVTFTGEFDRVQHAGINPLPIQRPIPIWFGGAAEPVLRRAARHGQGWIPLGQPDASMQSRLERLHGYLHAAGRTPEGFGIEAWIRSNSGTPDDWRNAAEQWVTLGASHLTFYTSGLGVGAVPQQIEALRRFYEAVR